MPENGLFRMRSALGEAALDSKRDDGVVEASARRIGVVVDNDEASTCWLATVGLIGRRLVESARHSVSVRAALPKHAIDRYPVLSAPSDTPESLF